MYLFNIFQEKVKGGSLFFGVFGFKQHLPMSSESESGKGTSLGVVLVVEAFFAVEAGVFGSSGFADFGSGVTALLFGVCADFGVDVAFGLADFTGVFTVFSLLSAAVFFLDAALTEGVAPVFDNTGPAVFFTGVASLFAFALTT